MESEFPAFCHCCGYQTIGCDYEICAICGWEYDAVQASDPDSTGANGMSLRQAQNNYVTIGSISAGASLRQPQLKDVRDPNWKLLPSFLPKRDARK
jgi:hypothetical protein